MTQDEDYTCGSYCPHGGVCVLSEGHELPHDSRYCQWSDDEALCKEDADTVIIDADPLLGPLIATMDPGPEAIRAWAAIEEEP